MVSQLTTAPPGVRPDPQDRGGGLLSELRPLVFLRQLSTGRSLLWPGLVLFVVLLANLPALAGLVNVSPLGPVGETAVRVGPGFLGGVWYTDPQIGYTSQALGHLAALAWLHGHIPWWNPFEGLGVPLAAEMQSAAFFPPTLLLALPQGQLYLHMLLEAAGGLGTYLLMREMRFTRPVASFGGALFALNGTFSWFGHAAANPVALLPFTLLGIERLFRRSARDWGGVAIIALSVALSFYAGFPETAYLDALMAALWFAVRLVRRPACGRPLYTGKVVLGVLIGGLLAAPLAIAFFDYLPVAFSGAHAGHLVGRHAYGPAMMALGLPYLYGPLLGVPGGTPGATARAAWENFGGFVTAPVIVLALLGLLAGKKDRLLRAALALGTVVVLLWTFGVGPVQSVLEGVVPGARDVWVARYSEPTWELALVLLGCFGLDALAGKGRWIAAKAGLACAAVGGLLAFDVYQAQAALTPLDRAAPSHVSDARTMVIYAGSLVVAMGGLAAISRIRGGRGRHARHAGDAPPPAGPRADTWRSRPRPGGVVAVAVLAVLAVLDAGAMFMMPSLSAPRSETVDTGPATYLAAHLGNARFFSARVYLPDYGSYFQLAALDSNGSLEPKVWNQFVREHLAHNVSALYFGTHTRTLRPTSAEALVRNLASYEALGVKYAIFPPSVPVFGPTGHLSDGVSLVYSDSLADIYALPAYRPYLSTPGSDCTVRAAGTDPTTASFYCPRPSRLVRDELYFTGWSATVNGRPARISETDGVLESIQLPAGRGTVRFSYLPAHEGLGLVLFATGLVLLGVLLALTFALALARRRRTRSPRDLPARPSDGHLRAGEAP